MTVFTTLKVEVPGVPPSVNHMYGRGRGRAWRTPDVESFLFDVTRLVRNKAVHHRGLRDDWRQAVHEDACRIRIKMIWHRPDETQRDSSNVIKVLEDGIATALDVDDQYFEWSTRSAYDYRNPRVELSISLEGGADG